LSCSRSRLCSDAGTCHHAAPAPGRKLRRGRSAEAGSETGEGHHGVDGQFRFRPVRDPAGCEVQARRLVGKLRDVNLEVVMQSGTPTASAATPTT